MQFTNLCVNMYINTFYVGIYLFFFDMCVYIHIYGLCRYIYVYISVYLCVHVLDFIELQFSMCVMLYCIKIIICSPCHSKQIILTWTKMNMVHPLKVKMKHWVNIMRPYPEHIILDCLWQILDKRTTLGRQDRSTVPCLQNMMDIVVKHQQMKVRQTILQHLCQMLGVFSYTVNENTYRRFTFLRIYFIETQVFGLKPNMKANTKTLKSKDTR